jgi:hypothetical protein
MAKTKHRQLLKEVDHSQAIRDWLHANDAISLTDGTLGNSTVELYAVGQTTVLLQVHANNNGWDVFIPACKENNTAKTLAALDIHVAHEPARDDLLGRKS